MQNSINSKKLNEEEILERINKIVLIRIKTLIVKSLGKDDIPEFERIVKSGNSNKLLSFATSKNPNLSKQIYQEVEKIRQEINL